MKTTTFTLTLIALSLSTLSMSQPRQARMDTSQTMDHQAQRERAQAMKKQIESQKIAYITGELQMTPEEAQTFWPLYNAYQAEKEALRDRDYKQWRTDREEPIDLAQLDERMKHRFAAERAQTDLDEAYYEKYKTVLPPEKVVGFYRAEREFRRKMMREMRSRGDGRDGDSRPGHRRMGK